MPKPKDQSKHSYMFSDDMKFLQKVVIFHPQNPTLILILRRSKDSYSRPGDWDFPGGNVLYGERHDDSLLREIKEETGLEVYNLQPVEIITRFDSNTNIYYLIINWQAQCHSENVVISKEHSEYKWVNFKELEKLNLVDFMLETARKAKFNPIISQ